MHFWKGAPADSGERVNFGTLEANFIIGRRDLCESHSAVAFRVLVRFRSEALVDPTVSGGKGEK